MLLIKYKCCDFIEGVLDGKVFPIYFPFLSKKLYSASTIDSIIGILYNEREFIISIINLFIAYKLYDYLKVEEKKTIRIPIAMNTSNDYIYQTFDVKTID